MNSSKVADYTPPEELSNKLHIGLKTSARTLKATHYQFICSKVLMNKWLKTYKALLRYKQLAKVFESFYSNYLDRGKKSLQGYVGGIFYTKKLVFYKFILVRTRLVKIPAGI